VFWIRKTIRKVTIVVPVLIISCHVSEKWKMGPVAAHTWIMEIAPRKAHFDPSHPEAEAANLPNASPLVSAVIWVETLLDSLFDRFLDRNFGSAQISSFLKKAFDDSFWRQAQSDAYQSTVSR
jgi:hypothetical protein